MKRCLKIMLAVMLVMTMLVPTLAVNAATVTTNKGYVLVAEDFANVTNFNLVTATRDANNDGAVDTAWTKSTSYPIGDSDWVFRTNASSYFANSSKIDASVTEDGALSLNAGGGGSFAFTASNANAMNRVPAVLYDGDYSNVGDDFKISFDFSKSVNLGACIKFMVNDGVASYYALNIEGAAGKELWNLYKVTNNGAPVVLISAPETITATTNNAGEGGINSGSITVVYEDGKISWEIDAFRYGNHPYKHTGTYTDATPFDVLPSQCTFGFSTNQNADQKISVDNIKFSYSVPDITEDFSSADITKDTAFANAAGVQSVRTNITGTDLYVTTRRNSNDKRLSAKVDSSTGKLNISYPDASIFNTAQINKLDFVEYRGSDFEGVGENYTLSFDYSTGQGRNSGYFIFGLENNGEEDFEYTDYYALVFNGEVELSLYVNNGEATEANPVPAWEIRKMTGGDTWSDTIVKSNYTFVKDADTTLRNTINANSIKNANVTLTVNNGVATVTVDHDRDGGTPDVKTFDITSEGNRFGFSNGSKDSSTGNFDNIVLTADKKAVEPIEDKVYIYGGKFAQKGGVLVFEVPNGENVSYTNVPVTIVTHEQATANIPEGATKAFFWNNFENLYPLNASVEITQ